VTVVPLLFNVLRIELPQHSLTSRFLFNCFMYILTPALAFCKLIRVSHNYTWEWFLPILINTILGIIIGTFLGWMFRRVKNSIPK
jgi:hypothetical protein